MYTSKSTHTCTRVRGYAPITYLQFSAPYVHVMSLARDALAQVFQSFT